MNKTTAEVHYISGTRAHKHIYEHDFSAINNNKDIDDDIVACRLQQQQHQKHQRTPQQI